MAKSARSIADLLREARASARGGRIREPALRQRGGKQSHMLADVKRILRLTPEARLIELGSASRLLSAAHRRG